MKDIRDFDIFTQLDTLFEHIKSHNRVAKIVTGSVTISNNIVIDSTTYRSLTLRLLKDGLLEDTGSPTNGTYIVTIEGRVFIGYVKKEELRTKREKEEEEAKKIKDKIDKSQLEANESSIKQNNISRKIAISALVVAIFAVLVPFAQWIFDKTDSSDTLPRKLKEQLDKQQSKIDSIEKSLSGQYSKHDTTSEKKPK